MSSLTSLGHQGPVLEKHFTAVIYGFSLQARVFVPGKPFQLSLVFVGNAGAYLSETPFRCSGLTHKH